MYMCAGGYALYYMIATAVAIFFCITVFFIKQPQEINQSANEKKGRSAGDVEPIEEEETKPKIEVKGRWIVEILLTPECMVAVCSMSVVCMRVENCR